MLCSTTVVSSLRSWNELVEDDAVVTYVSSGATRRRRRPSSSPKERRTAPTQTPRPGTLLERILPFESWREVERVADECGRWGALVIFLADSGARPAEALSVEHRHLDGATVELPGTKTDAAWRTVHLTRRGVEAVTSVSRSIATRRVFHVDGRPVSWPYFWREVWP
jgi:integrase